MTDKQKTLPQLSGRTFIADGGIETTLIFLEGLELPYFAAFDLFKSDKGYKVLQKYFRTYAAMARDYSVGLILESATWRASADWGAKLGYSANDLAEFNRKAITLLEDIRKEFESERTPIVISGCIGPRGDGYNPSELLSAAEAEKYHRQQIETFSQTAADMVSAITMTHTGEAVGVASAAKKAGLPAVIAFTVETDGRLPTGQTLKEAIEETDKATGSAPVYYMINCAHPTHFEKVLAGKEKWTDRIRGVRANASCKSHAELNESTQLDIGDPKEFGSQYRQLKTVLKNLNVLGGCCGTDHRHLEEICKACVGVKTR